MSSNQKHHNLKRLVDIDIHLDRDDGSIYYAGETVKGHVTLKAKEGFKLKEVCASLCGRSSSIVAGKQEQHSIYSSKSVTLTSKQPQEPIDSMLYSMILFEPGDVSTYSFELVLPTATSCFKPRCRNNAAAKNDSILPSISCSHNSSGIKIQVVWFIDISLRRPNNQSRAIVERKLLNVGRKNETPVEESPNDYNQYFQNPSSAASLSVPRTPTTLPASKAHGVIYKLFDRLLVEFELFVYKQEKLRIGQPVRVDCTLGIPGSTMRKLSLSPEARLVCLERIKISIVQAGDITTDGGSKTIKSNVYLGDSVLVDVYPGVNMDLRDCIPTVDLSLLNCGWNHTSVELYNPDMHVLDITEFIPPLEIPHVLPSGLKCCCFNVYGNPELNFEVTLSTRNVHESVSSWTKASNVTLRVKNGYTKLL